MNMRIVLLLFSFAFCSAPSLAATLNEPFRFHASVEPSSVDPAAWTEATGGFIMFNLFRGLYRLDANGQPQPELAKACVTKGSQVICTLNPTCKWSDGTPITAHDFAFSLQRLIRPETKSLHKQLLFSIKNAREIASGKIAPDQLGLKVMDEQTLAFELAAPDSEFLYRLASPVLTPLKGEPPQSAQNYTTLITNGPYQISGWQKLSRIGLAPNAHYCGQNSGRPDIEVLLVDDDTAAKNLFDLGKLSFLRRLLTKEIPLHQKKPNFYFLPTLRFDYIGFGPGLKDSPDLRKALSLSLNLGELTRLFYSPGQFGCPSLPRKMTEPWHCVRADLTAAKRALAKAKKRGPLPHLELVFSKASGEDVARAMEWMQNQWMKHLGLAVDLRPTEQGVLQQELRQGAPAIFRKGFNLDRPTCTAALENFLPGSPENYVRFEDDKFTALVANLKSEPDVKKKARLCSQAIDRLLKTHQLVPLGELHFAMLASPEFEGWRLSLLNQLDLTELKRKTSPAGIPKK